MRGFPEKLPIVPGDMGVLQFDGLESIGNLASQ
jgi:hypothetical protein